MLATRHRALSPTSVDDTRWGGTVGVGLEYRLRAELVGRSRIRSPVHAGNRTYTFNDAVLRRRRSRTERIRQDVDLVTVRVNYRWGGPVVAKY